MNIVHQYKADRLIGQRVFDFLNRLYPTPSDMEILEKWQEFFRGKGIPHFVTQEASGVSKLWKRVEVAAVDGKMGSCIFDGDGVEAVEADESESTLFKTIEELCQLIKAYEYWSYRLSDPTKIQAKAEEFVNEVLAWAMANSTGGVQ